MKRNTSPGVGTILCSNELFTGTILEYGRSEGGSTYRVVEYVPHPGVKMHKERSRQWCAGPGDTSPSTGGDIGGTYDSRCGWCYLGYGHSVWAHEAEIGA